jgi:glycosyltransferase involved in cell wall biosynthesis
MRTPLLLVGDGPQEATGLGRILRDLGSHIIESDLPVELASAGGPVPPVWRAWPHYPLDERLQRGEDWGASYIEAIWESHFGRRPGILWMIWDPSRLAYYRDLQIPVQRWAYPAIDTENRNGTIGGPAGEAVMRLDRIIAYGRWASRVYKTLREDPVPYLPHGIQLRDFSTSTYQHHEGEQDWAHEQLGPHVKQHDKIIGCVATNTARKDLGLYFQTLHELRTRGIPVYGWLHTDVLVKAWSIQQLVEDCGLAKRVTVTLSQYSDRQLAALYQTCDATIAPGLGEGFGYPIVESLASGVPVAHVDYGGGRELIPKIEWRYPVREMRLEGIYALQRPVCRAEDVANAIERIFDWQQEVGSVAAKAYCVGAVGHLDWARLWPRWHAWIKAGL